MVYWLAQGHAVYCVQPLHAILLLLSSGCCSSKFPLMDFDSSTVPGGFAALSLSCPCILLCLLQRGKKRHWKEAYHSSADEVFALHTQLLAKHRDLEVLEAHLNQLHTELVMLKINSGGAVQQEQRPGAQGRSECILQSLLAT